MGKSAGPPTGYVSPQDQQGTHREGGFGNVGGQDVPNTPGVYQKAAEATAQANRPTQNSPFGTSSWTQDPTTGAWTQNTGFAPGMQSAFQGMQDQMSSLWGTPLDNGAGARDKAENAIYGRETARLDPQYAQREQAMNAQLANQGLAPGSTAATAMQGQFGRDRNDAYATAQREAIIGGGAEASRQQAMDLQARMAPLQGLQGLRALLQMYPFQPGANYLAAVQAENDYKVADAAQRNQMYGDIIGGAATLGAAGIGAANK